MEGASMELVIGTKAWSTWSLRPWLVLKRTGVEFREIMIPLRQEQGAHLAAILKHSSTGMVPALKDGDVLISDSLPICESLAERFPEMNLWPRDPRMRAYARSAVAEMHSGFASLRGECPMDLTMWPKAKTLSEATHKDIRRIVKLWSARSIMSHGMTTMGISSDGGAR